MGPCGMGLEAWPSHDASTILLLLPLRRQSPLALRHRRVCSSCCISRIAVLRTTTAVGGRQQWHRAWWQRPKQGWMETTDDKAGGGGGERTQRGYCVVCDPRTALPCFFACRCLCPPDLHRHRVQHGDRCWGRGGVWVLCALWPHCPAPEPPAEVRMPPCLLPAPQCIHAARLSLQVFGCALTAAGKSQRTVCLPTHPQPHTPRTPYHPPRPCRQLFDFERVHLEAGAATSVTFTVSQATWTRCRVAG